MVYRHRWHGQRRRQRLGEGGADEQGAGEAGPLRVRNDIDPRQRTAAGGKNLPQQRYEAADVIA